MILIIGDRNSGKSAFAEKLIMELYEQDMQAPLYYVATMEAVDETAKARIQKHRAMRADKPFVTLERERDLFSIQFPQKGYVLLECLTNLVGNEMFQAQLRGAALEEQIQNEIAYLEKNSIKLVVVAGTVTKAGECYDEETKHYIESLAQINTLLMNEAEIVYRVVDGVGYVVE